MTVPQRRNNLLIRTLASLKKAGFDQPRLLVDGSNDPQSYEKEFNLEVTCRSPNIRTFGNWMLGMAELYIRNPCARLYAMFQDDFVTYIGLREYLSKCDYPDKGYFNLYTFPSNQDDSKSGWYPGALLRSGQPGYQTGRGAVALVFTNEGLTTLLNHTHTIQRPKDPSRGHRSVDGGIVSAMNKAGYTEYVHNPSLVQHTGHISAMKNRPHKLATSFRGEDFDVSTLLTPDQRAGVKRVTLG